MMVNSSSAQNRSGKGWFDDKRNVKKIITALVIICLVLFVSDAFYQKHPYFIVESLFGFYALYGFVMCVALVLVAKWMRKFVMRVEDYYDKEHEND
tara:strand:- start:479 stop:766 length:288 start_codon:yes stop_codon:yes gene_type:complete